MANWFRLCENRHTDRHRQLRIAQGPLPPHLFPPLSPLPVHLSSSSSASTHTPSPSGRGQFHPSFLSSLPPRVPPSLLPSILGAAAGGAGVDSSGWWVEDCVERESQSGAYLLGMQRYGLWIIYLWSQSTITDCSLKRLPLLLLVFHACTWLCHFVKLKDMFMYCTSAKRLICHCTKATGWMAF